MTRRVSWASRFLLSLWVAVSVNACGDDEPAVDVRSGDDWAVVAIRSYAIDGQRDGRRTRATATYEFVDGGRLRVWFDITYNPQPQLAASRWEFDGEPAGAGTVVDLSMKFFGGQGEGPSLGGRFRLDQDGHPRFRIAVPLAPVRAPTWSAP